MDGGRSEEEEEDVVNGDPDALAWKDFFGSSVSLAPSLLSIFDRQVAANGSECNSLESGSSTRRKDDIDHKPDPTRPAFRDELSPQSVDTDIGSGVSENGLIRFADNNSDVRMLSSLCVGRSETDLDLKKRPLSLRSTSSNSSLSLSLQPHQRKKVARDGTNEKSGVSPLSIFCDSCELPPLSENQQKAGGGLCHANSVMCRSQFTKAGWGTSRVSYIDQKGHGCLSGMINNQGYLCMEVDQDLEWSPTSNAGEEALETGLSCLHRVESLSCMDRVVLEIVETERAYVRDLHDIIKGYVERIRASCGLLSKLDADTLFGNIEDIYSFHCDFLQKLEKSGTDPVRIAECFVKSSDGFTVYSDYCTNYPRSVSILTRCIQDRRIAEVLRRQQMSLQHGLPLGSYLLKPVQRILKYHLLLQNLLNNYNQSESGYETISQAFGSMMSVAQRINEMKRAHERSVRIQEIQSLLYDWSGIDPSTYGDLALEGQFQMFGAKAFRLVWVFQKAVIIAKKKEDETVQIKAAIMFSNLMLVETIQRAPLNFHLIPFDNPKVQYTVQARTMDQKRHWCQEIKKLILENYEAVIPEKAKQLVMMLGKEEEPALTMEADAAFVEPTKNSGNLERRKGRQRSIGFIPDLGILKLKKASKAESPGTATPDSDTSWKSGVPDGFSRGLELKGVPESFTQNLDQKPRTLHMSFSLQNIQSPLSVAPLRKMGGSEGDWHSQSSSHLPHFQTKKMLTAGSLEEELSESDSNLNLSRSSDVRCHHDWSCRVTSKDSIVKSRTPTISEEPIPGDYRYPLLTLNSPSPYTDIQVRHHNSLKNGCSDFTEGIPNGTVSVNKRQLLRDFSLPDCSTQPKDQTSIHNFRIGNTPLFDEDRSCSSDSLNRQSRVLKSFGNVFVDRTAFLVSESVGCMGSNRMLDRRLARLCTPPRELGSPAFVRDVHLSKERGKTVVHYGTPMRTVELPDDICDGTRNHGSVMENEVTENQFKPEMSVRTIIRGKNKECSILSESSQILQSHPRRSTSVQEDLINSYVYMPSENSSKPKPKRSDSFHGHSFYSASGLHPGISSSKLSGAEQRAPVNSFKNTLLSWTDKLTKRRSHSSENHSELFAEASGSEVGSEKTKLKPSLLVSRLARASYRKLKREKATEVTDSLEPFDMRSSGVTDATKFEKDVCNRSQPLVVEGTHVLSSYALTSLPRQNRTENETGVRPRNQFAIHISEEESALVETLTSEPFVRRPRGCHMIEKRDAIENTEPQRLLCDDVVYHLSYIDEDGVSIISEQNEETDSNRNIDCSKVSSPIKTKACSAISLPGMRNGFVWSSSMHTTSPGSGWMQTSFSTEGRLNCFTAPRGHWIPYIDDSGDED